MKCYGRNLLAASLLVSTAVCSAAERGSSSAAAAASSKESADHTSTQLRGAAAAAAAANHHHRHHRSLKKEENDHSNNNENNTKKNKKSERSDDYLASSATFTTTTTTTAAPSGTAARGNPGPARQFLSSTSTTGSDGTASHSPNAVRSSANSDSASTFRGPEAVASRSSPAYTGGIPCVPSANTKFTCCNNGLSECGGDYDCCDAYRNICVNTANLQGYQLRNLRCKNSSEGQAVSTANNNNNNNGNNGQKAVKVDEDGKKDIVDASSPQLPPPVIPMIPPKTANKDTNTVDKAVSGSTTAIKNTSYRPYTPPSYTTAAASSSVKTTSAAASSTTVQKVPAIVRASANSDSGTEFRGSSPNDAGSTGTESSSGTQPTTTTTAAGTTTTPRPAATRNSPAYTGIPCVPSANNKFRCCNGGLADCGGDYDCCDAYRNICVNTANLQGYQLRNLRCKGAQQPMVQQVQPLEKEPIDASALDIPAQTSSGAQAVKVKDAPAIVRASANSNSGAEFRGPSESAGNSPAATATTTKAVAPVKTTSTTGAAAARSPAFSTGIPCVQSNNAKFRCCNNGLSDCGGDYDCCDAYRNICVNKANLQGYQLRNLKCKGAQTSPQAATPVKIEEAVDVSALDIPPQQVPIPSNEATMTTSYSSNTNNAQSSAKFTGTTTYVDSAPVNVNRGNAPVIAGHQIWYEHEGGNIPQANQEAGNSLEISGPSTSNAAVPHSNSNVVTASNANRVSVKDAPCQGSDPAATSYGIVDAYQRWLDHSPANPSVWGSCTATSQCPPGSCCLGHPLGGACINLEDVCEEGERNCPYPNGITVKLCLCDAEPPSNGLAYGPKGNGGGDERPLALGLAEDEFGK